jgi:hypothetical protein
MDKMVADVLAAGLAGRSSRPETLAQNALFGRGTLSPACEQFTAHIGGSLRGRAKTQVALREGIPVRLRPRLAGFTAAN